MNADRTFVPADRRVAPMDWTTRVVMVGAGSFGLVLIVFLGTILQVGVVQCAVCAGNVCGPGVEVCPDSAVGLGLIVGLLAAASVMIAVGLSGWTVTRRAGATKRSESLPAAPTDLDFLAPLLLFFGWGLLALGLLLPWNVFGTCYYGPCVYAYDLSGYPLVLVVSGTIAIASGAPLLAWTGIRRRRGLLR